MPDDYPHDEPADQDAPRTEPDPPDADGEESSVDQTGDELTAAADPAPGGPDTPSEPDADAADAMTVASRPAGDLASGSGDLDDEATSPEWSGRNTANQRNEFILGQLFIYYTERTIAVPMDADAALRAISIWRYSDARRGLWEDRIDPVTAPGTVSWAGLSVDGVLSMVWIPGLPRESRPERVTLDPTVA